MQHQGIDMVQQMNPDGELHWYPGSLWLVRQLMGKQDSALLFELGNDEIKTLHAVFNTANNIEIEHADGLQALYNLLPPRQDQVLVLMDPAYKMKHDYVLAANTLKNAYQYYAKGLYMIWYPVIERAQIQYLENELLSSGIENILQAELTVTPQFTPGMTGSGIIVINPPASLQEKLRQILPYLAERLSLVDQNNHSGAWRIVYPRP
jgi:23S rRNA (adenine2030-N6)-methyltransferase